MPNNSLQQSDLIREYLDGSLSSEQMSEVERFIEADPDARTVPDVHDKLETFVTRLQEALAMPKFPSEQNDQSNGDIRQAVSEQLRQSANLDETAAVISGDPSVSTDADKPGGGQNSLPFLSPAQSPGEIGRLNGYRVLKLLGEGGMGMVFEAEDVRLKRRVALKVMKPEVAAKEQHRLRFTREAETAAKVEHDHICPIYQVGDENGVPFIAMPFLKGEPLDVRLKRQKPLPIAEAIRIGREVAEGLAAAHDAGLVHRDIKPGNIWLEALAKGRTRVRILDFGLARFQGDDINITQSGAIMGTPAYMAPEQARGKPVDHRADLFSLGVLLYEMTTAQRPFTGGDTMSILTSLAVDTPTAPNQLITAIPPALSNLIMRLLSKSPEKRPADGREVAESLMAILMQTAQPVVEAIPSSAAPPLATDATAIDPWNAIDDSTPIAEPVSRDAKALRSGARTPKRSWSNGVKVAIAAALLLFAGAGFAAYKLFFETKDGTLIVEVDRDADVRFKNGELQIFDAEGKLKYTLKPGERSKTMPPGPYKVQVVSADGVRLDTDKFEMTKDGKVTLRVTADAVVVAKKDSGKNEPKKNGNESTPQPLTRLLLSDKDSVSFATLKHLPLKGDLTLEGFVTMREKHGGGNRLLIGEWLHQSLAVTDDVWTSFVVHKIIKPSELMVPDRRVHLAIVRSAQQSRFYVNGKLAGTQEGSGERVSGHEAEFGLFGAGTRVEFDEIRISTVARYRDKEFTPTQRFETDKDTLALYHCDDGQGDQLTDSSGNGHHGKIVGAKWVKADGTPIDKRKPLSVAEILASSDYEWAPPQNLGKAINGGRRNLGATLTADECIMVFSRDGKLWLSRRDNPAEPFVKAERLPDSINVGVSEELTMSADGLLLVHKSARPGKTAEHVWMTRRKSIAEPFGDPVRLPDAVNSSEFVRSPLLSADGLTLFVTIIRKDGAGGGEIVMFTRKTRDDPFGNETLLPPPVNTPVYDTADWLSPDGRVLIATKMGTPPFETRFFVRPSLDAPFQEGQSLRSAFSSGRPWLSPDGQRIYFHARDLPGQQGDLDLWVSRRVLKGRFTNTLGMDFALVPKGKAWLGGGNGRVGDKVVEINDDFYLGTYEVTQAEWVKVMGDNPSSFTDVPGVAKDKIAKFPVERVTWDDAQEFLNRLNAQAKDTGWTYRLPTEIEWEYACRGGPMKDPAESQFEYYLDVSANQLLPQQANYDHPAAPKRTKEVGSYKPNRLGLYDMHGNVSEWCQDEILKKGANPNRIFRGGNWSDNPSAVSVNSRDPGGSLSTTKQPTVGLRVARCRVVVADPDRRAAEWVLSIGGIVKVNGHPRQIKTAADLPAGVLRLTEVSFEGSPKATDASLAIFKDCKNLTGLSLQGVSVGNEGVAFFKDCKNLIHLNLIGTKVTDVGLLHFKNCKNLIQLELGSTQVGDLGLAAFKDCENLSTLGLGGTKVSNAGLVHFKNCKNLTSLGLRDTRVSDEGLANFKDFKNLTILYLYGTQVTDAGLAHFAGCKSLTHLYLSSTQVSDAAIPQLKNYKDLAGLTIEKTKLSAAGIDELLKALPQCEITCDRGVIEPKVRLDPDRQAAEWLFARGAQFSITTRAGYRKIRPQDGDTLPAGPLMLQSFGLSAKQFDDADMARFRNLAQLNTLILNGTGIGDSGIEHIATLPLVRLYLGDSKVTDKGLKHLSTCRGLVELLLTNTNVTDAGLATLQELSRLEQLHVFGTKVTEAGVRKFAAQLPQCKIFWNGGVIEPRDRKAAQWVLSIGGKIKIRVAEQEREIVAIKDLPAESFQLLVIDLIGNKQITDAGLENLKSLSNLKQLNVKGTKVTADGVKKLAVALPDCAIASDSEKSKP